MNDKEIARLSAYLNAGGILFAESAMGSEQFEDSFKHMLDRATSRLQARRVGPRAPHFF